MSRPATLATVPLDLAPPTARVAARLPAAGPVLWSVAAERQADAALALAPALLDEGELRRLAAFRRAGDRHSFAAAHVALRLILGGLLGLGPKEVPLTREPCPTCGGPHGRPSVAGGGPHFSLSHSEGVVLLGCARGPLGVDVEGLPRAETVAEVSGSLHPGEVAELAALPVPERGAAFGRVWTRKEAYLKGLGTGLSRDPALDYVGCGALPASPDPAWLLSDVEAPEGFTAAVAYRTD